MPGFSHSDLDLDDIRLVLACARRMKLSVAAKELGIAQSTASRKLDKLEDKLGRKLFARGKGGLTPSDALRSLLPAAVELEQKWAEFERRLSAVDDDKGAVRVAIPEGLASYWLLPRLPEFMALYPDACLELDVHASSAAAHRRKADFSLRGSPSTSANVVSRRLGLLELAPCIHPKLQEVPVQELRWIYYEDQSHTLEEIQWIEHHVAPQRILRVSQRNALFAACRAGLGAALIPPIFARVGGLVVVKDLPRVPHRELFLVYPDFLRAVPRFAQFREWVVDVARETFPQEAPDCE